MMILHGDSLGELKKLEPNSIDFVCTDPPYGTVDGKGKVHRQLGKMVSFNPGEWDTSLPLLWIAEAMRVLKEGCWIVIFTDNLSVKQVWDELEANGGNCKQTFYWVKNNPPPQPRKNFCSGVETAVLATKGAVKKWNAGGWNLNYKIAPIVGGKERTAHPTQKPLSVMKYLIEILSEEGDTVLDPFCGSGTTCVAAKQLNRIPIGIEREAEYVEIAEARLDAVEEPQPTLL